MPDTLRLWGAFLLVKTVKTLTRLRGGEGTSLPGGLALRVMPKALKAVRSRLHSVILVTGTNGKTTTTRILADIARESGFKVITNSLGANLKQGITTALLDRLPETKKALAIIEVDEATLPKVIEDLQPEAIIVTNFFRDQMDRYAELDHVVATVRRAIDLVPSARRVLNADDPLTRGLGEKKDKDLDVLYFGLAPECGVKDLENVDQNVLDGQTCKHCGERLEYSARFYGQLGDYSCSCGFARPVPEVEGKNLNLSSEGYAFRALDYDALLCSPGRYNVYNALAAIAGAHAMGWPAEAIARSVARIHTDIGRMEKLKGPEKEIVLTLVKNPTGLNEVLKVLANEQEQHDVLMVLNDQAADGRDVSWIWDADIEKLERSRIDKLVASGTRCWDMAVRLKYAGLGEPVVESSPFKAVDDLIKDSNQPLHLLTTYTTLYALRDHLAKRGFKHG